MPNCQEIKVHQDSLGEVPICRDECAISIEVIEAETNYEEGTIVFSVTGISGNQGDGLWYYWEYDTELFELCDGGNTYSETLCLKRKDASPLEINTEISVTIEDGVKCEETFTDEFSFDFCYLSANEITVNVVGNVVNVSIDELEGENPFVYNWSYTNSGDFELLSENTNGSTLSLRILTNTTSTISVTVVDSIGCELELTTEEESYTLCEIIGGEVDYEQEGNTVVFTAIGFGGTAPYTYQWTYDEENFQLESETNDDELILTIILEDTHTSEVSVTITDSLGCTTTLTTGEVEWELACQLEFDEMTVLPYKIDSDTYIYVFYDATSMSKAVATEANTVIDEWFNSISGIFGIPPQNLYKLPVLTERWVQYASFPWRGKLSSYPSETAFPDVLAGAAWDLDNNGNPLKVLPLGITNNASATKTIDFVPVSKAVVISFVDESYSAYHSAKNPVDYTQTNISIGNPANNEAQPTTEFISDYNNFVSDYANYTYFKCFVYPVIKNQNAHKNLILQVLASLKNTTYTLGQIDAYSPNPYMVGTQWDALKTLLQASNPYSTINTNSYVGLEDFGFKLSTDKTDTSGAFTTGILGEDLNEFFEPVEVDVVSIQVYINNLNLPATYDWTGGYDNEIFTFVSQNENEVTFSINEDYLGEDILNTNISVTVTDNKGCEIVIEKQYSLVYNEDGGYTQTIS